MVGSSPCAAPVMVSRYLPPSDPLLLRIPCGSRLRLFAGPSWLYAEDWDNQPESLLSLRGEGAQAKVVISEPLEAMARGDRPSRYHKIYFDLCLHSTPGHFRVDADELETLRYSFEPAPGAPCSWCKNRTYCGILTLARGCNLPQGKEFTIGAFLAVWFATKGEYRCLDAPTPRLEVNSED